MKKFADNLIMANLICSHWRFFFLFVHKFNIDLTWPTPKDPKGISFLLFNVSNKNVGINVENPEVCNIYLHVWIIVVKPKFDLKYL